MNGTVDESKKSNITPERSKGLGANIQFFLDQLNLSAKTDEQRKALFAYADVMAVAELIVKGELIITEA